MTVHFWGWNCICQVVSHFSKADTSCCRRAESCFEEMKAGTSSGPVTLCIFRSRSSLRTPFRCTCIESIVGWSLEPFFGMFDLSSRVYAETNWSFKISTFELLSLWMKPSLFFSGATPVGSCRFLLMYDQNTFGFSFRSLLTISSMYYLWADLMSFCACILKRLYLFQSTGLLVCFALWNALFLRLEARRSRVSTHG